MKIGLGISISVLVLVRSLEVEFILFLALILVLRWWSGYVMGILGMKWYFRVGILRSGGVLYEAEAY